MSYQTGTTHFNLPQTTASDKRDWSDTNQAFADVDAALYQAGQDATTAIGAAQTAQTTADGAATTAQGAVTTANGASATAQTASETAQLANTAAQAAQSTANGAVTTANSASSTAQAAQTTASNADTVALRAESKADTALANIGTLANLQTTDKSSLVAAINEVLSQIGGGGMVADLGTKLHDFTTGNLSYTSPAGGCFLVGSATSSASGQLLVDNVPLFKQADSGDTFRWTCPFNQYIPEGLVITAPSAQNSLHVYAVLQ